MRPQCLYYSQQQGENQPPGISKQLLRVKEYYLQKFSELLKHHENLGA